MFLTHCSHQTKVLHLQVWVCVCVAAADEGAFFLGVVADFLTFTLVSVVGV